MHAPNRPGLALIEIVVAIATIALLLAMVLPAVVALRETSRKTDCTGRMVDLGKAILEHEALHRRLPGHGWRIKLLPFIGQRPLWDGVSALPSFIEAEPHYRAARIDRYVCPSDGAPADSAGLARGANYSGCYAGSPFGSTTGMADDAREDGMFPVSADPPPADPMASRRSKGRRVSEVVDGMSTTAMLSELRQSDGGASRLRNVWFLPPAFPAPASDQLTSTCERLPPAPADHGYLGDAAGLGTPWYFGDWGHGVYNHVLPPNRPSCRPESSNRLSIYTAASFHPGGVNLLWGDGRVTFETEGVDRRVWRSMGKIDDLLQSR